MRRGFVGGSTDGVSGAHVRTRAASLAATAAVLAANRSATLPDIAAAAGVARTTLHRYFSNRKRLIHEATMDSIGVLTEQLIQSATDDGSAIDAMRRVIAALVSVADRVLFVFGDPGVLRNIPRADHPYSLLVLELIKRGQADGTFDPELSAEWIEHVLFAVVVRGCEDAGAGDLPRYAVASTIIRTFERGVCISSEQAPTRTSG